MRKSDRKKLDRALARAPAPGTAPRAPSLPIVRHIKVQKARIAYVTRLWREAEGQIPKFPVKLVAADQTRWVVAENKDGAFITKVCFDALQERYWDECARVRTGKAVWLDRVVGTLP